MIESYWWCANCKEEVDGSHVTYGEMHDNCGHPVESITPEKQERIAELETALREIQEQLFSSWFSPDMVKQVVRKALEGKCGFSMEGRNE